MTSRDLRHLSKNALRNNENVDFLKSVRELRISIERLALALPRHHMDIKGNNDFLEELGRFSYPVTEILIKYEDLQLDKEIWGAITIDPCEDFGEYEEFIEICARQPESTISDMMFCCQCYWVSTIIEDKVSGEKSARCDNQSCRT
jgi:hypothetical protein